MTIKLLTEKYIAERSYYLTNKYNETLLRSDFLDPFFELLGWDIKNNGNQPTNEREVILEEPLKANATENSKKPDYTFRLFSERKFFLEAKKPCVSIESNDESAKQVRRYGFTAKLKISVLSNFEYLIIYDTSIKVEKEDSFQKAIIKKYHYSEYESSFEEIKRFLGKESVYSGEFDIVWQGIEDKITHFSVDHLFLSQINEWRIQLGNEIYKSNHTIEPQNLNDIVQSYLNRILFLRVCEDRNLEDYQTLLKFANANDFKALIKKFEEADKKYNSGLFDQLLHETIIENISSVIWSIIKQLYYPESPYSFSVFSSDILGSIYEIFLSEKLIIHDGRVVLRRKPEHIERDIITTPAYIINDILKNTVVPKCKNKSDEEILKLKFVDISCGSGAFILLIFQLLNDILIDYYLANNPSKLIQVSISSYKLPFIVKKELLLNCIFGVDKDYNAVEATKLGLLLKLLEGEDVNSTFTIKPILPNLTNNIFFGNSLLNPGQVKNTSDFISINPFDFSDLRFDVIVGNPPYMKSSDMKSFTSLELPLYKQHYLSAYKQFDKYFLFIEKGLSLLKDDGILGYIVPSKFTKVGSGEKIRERLTDKGYLDTIVSFGANQIFTDKTTYTCILLLTKKHQSTFNYIEVSNLNEWKVRTHDNIKSLKIKTSTLDKECWVLVPLELINAYNKIISQSKKLLELVGENNIFNGIQTSANDVYIFLPTREDDEYYYFIKKGISFKIERSITKPYFQTSSGIDNLYSYRTFKPNSRVIFPYKNIENSIEIIPLTTMEQEFPFAYKYLIAHKDILNNPKRDMQPVPKNQNEWHRYGRSQCLDSCGLSAKIIVGVLSVGDKYAIDFYGTFISSGGTAGYCVVAIPSDSNYSIYYIQAILNSKYLEWFSTLYGEIFRGGYIARGTKVLNNLPIRVIDFKNPIEKSLHDKIAGLQANLINIYDQIDENSGNRRKIIPLESQFVKEKEELESTLSELFSLGGDDLLIPKIKELYETN